MLNLLMPPLHNVTGIIQGRGAQYVPGTLHKVAGHAAFCHSVLRTFSVPDAQWTHDGAAEGAAGFLAKVGDSMENRPMTPSEKQAKVSHRTDKKPGTWARVWMAASIGWQRLWCRAANGRRRLLRRRLPDYVALTVDGALLERDPIAPWYYSYLPGYRAPQSLEELERKLLRIAADPDIRGIVLFFKGAVLSLAQAQSLTATFDRFRHRSHALHGAAAGKRVVVFVEQANTGALVAASAADLLVMAPLAEWEIVGLRVAPLFLKETLARLGIEVQVVRVAPWKTAADGFICTELSDAAREQYNWLFDSLYADIVDGIAVRRRLDADTVQTLIDRAPLTATESLAGGLIDHVAYEDELPALLGSAEKPAAIKSFGRVDRLLYRRPQSPPSGTIGVISLSGTIMTGESRSFPISLPFLGDATIGSTTVQQLIRAARQDEDLDAVIVHVDSPGGSALASDLIWRDLALLNREKPVVVYMGDVAASGGYYIAAPGHKIVAQRATLTGSIGVIVAKANLAGAYSKAHVHEDEVVRGAHAGIYGETTAWRGDLLERLEQSLEQTYEAFKNRVSEGRSLDPAALDDLAGGRVWTGAQAHRRGLVDALGDFQTAVDLACAAAGLADSQRVAVVGIMEPKRWLAAEPAVATQLVLGQQRAQQVAALASFVLDGEMSNLLTRERVWLMAPFLPRV